MKQTIKNFYTEVFGITNKEHLDILAEHSTIVNVKKKEIFIHEGEEVNIAYFIDKGFAYGYQQKGENRKVICCLLSNRGWVCLSGSKLEKEIIKESIYCTEDSQFIGIPIPIAQQIISQSEEAKNAYIRQLVEISKFQNEMQLLRSLPVTERIQLFENKFGWINEHMNQGEIAALLDVSRAEYAKTKSAK